MLYFQPLTKRWTAAKFLELEAFFFFFLNLNDLEALTTCIRKVDFKPTLLFINEIKECGLNCILGSSFSTFGIVRYSLAFLKT